MPKSIVIADDHPLFLMGLRVSIGQLGGFKVVGEASTVDDLHHLLEMTKPDILITDFSMPGNKHMDGVRLIRTIRSRYPFMPVVVITILANPGLIDALYKYGVYKVINKQSISSELSKTLNLLGSFGATKLTRDNHRKSKILSKNKSKSGIETLSPREYEVMRLLAEGYNITQIAEMQNRSKQTISSQKKSGMVKLGVTSDAEFFEFIITTGL